MATSADNQHDRMATSDKDVASLSHVENRPRYAHDDRYGHDVEHEHSRYGDDDDGAQPAYRDWPECRGTCRNGKCDLQERHSGCCFLARSHEDSYYPTYDAAQAQSVHADDPDTATVPANTQGRQRGMLVCW